MMWLDTQCHVSAKFVFALTSALFTISLFVGASSAHPHAVRDSKILNVQYGESIQAAIDKADAGTQITVGAGIYAEQLTITKDGISLIGKGAILVPPAESTQNICTGIAGNGTTAGICIQGSDIELAPFQVEHQKVTSVGRPVSDVSVTGFFVNGFNGENIAVVGGSNVQVIDNSLLDGGQYGILSVGSIDTVIDRNVVTSSNNLGFIAICIDNEAGATAVRHNTAAGYYVGLCVQTSGAVLTGNHVSGTCVGASIDPGIDGSTVSSNFFGPTNPDCAIASAFNMGILIYGAVNSMVQYNVIQGQHLNMSAPGIALVDALEISPDLVARGNVVNYNILRDNDFDLFVNTTGTDNVVTPNTCTTPEELCS